MIIQKNDITLVLSPDEYFVRKLDRDFNGDYVLTTRIDMSYCGKPDQEGGYFMYLSDYEAKKFITAGFDEIIG